MSDSRVEERAQIPFSGWEKHQMIGVREVSGKCPPKYIPNHSGLGIKKNPDNLPQI